MIGCHALGGIAIKQSLEGRPGQIASPPRVGNQVQEVAGREKEIHRIAAVVRAGIARGFGVFELATSIRLWDKRLLGQVRPQQDISPFPFAQRQIPKWRQIDGVPGQPRKNVRLVMDQTPAVHIPNHEGG